MRNEITTIGEYEAIHQPAFERLYRNWFTAHFQMEPEPLDEFVLQHPEQAILDHGGAILVGLQEDRLAGTVALKKADSYTFELTKMVIGEEYRGKGLGKALVHAALNKAGSLGAKRVILYSHSSLRAALHIYLKLGFTEVLLEPGTYSHIRCDTKMELWLDKGLS
jgi:GNAT superfamily N-acetyltransferase